MVDISDRSLRAQQLKRNGVTPELLAEIEKARQEFRDGNCITLKTHEDVEHYFESI